MSDAMDEARIEAMARALYESTPDYKRMDIRSHVWTWSDVVAELPDVADEDRRRAGIALAAADAVGRGRVSEERRHQDAYIDAIASAMAERLEDKVEWIDLRRALGRVLGRVWFVVPAATVTAKTAAPPERHDAPGVTFTPEQTELMEWCVEQGKQAYFNGVGFDDDFFDKLQALEVALTGQPDAGRDPDAADAGGGAT